MPGSSRLPGRVGAEQPGRQLSAGEIGLRHRVDFLALAAALAQPPDDLLARILPVGHDAEQFEGTFLAKRLRRERQVRLVVQIQLAERLADRLSLNLSTHTALRSCINQSISRFIFFLT
jgi:hypothetical protein